MTIDMTSSVPTFGFGVHATFAERDELLRLARLADEIGLDVISLSDHPYVGDRIDAYAALGFILGRTQRLGGFVNVSNLPTRPAPMLARAVTSLSAMSDGRVILGIGAGGLWQHIARMGVPALSPSEAVDAFEEAITLIKQMSGGGPPVTLHGKHYRVDAIEPAPVEAVPVWTGSVGRKSLAATGRVADGWIPGHAADWRSARFRDSRPVIDDAAESVGRNPREIRTVFNLPGEISDRPLPRTRDDDNRWIGGSPAQWVDELVTAINDDAAAGFILFSPTGGSPDARSLSLWGNEIAPAVREAVSAQALS